MRCGGRVSVMMREYDNEGRRGKDMKMKKMR